MSDTVRNLSEAREIITGKSVFDDDSAAANYGLVGWGNRREAKGFISGILSSPLSDLMERAEVRELVTALEKSHTCGLTGFCEACTALQPFLSAGKESKKRDL